MRVKPEPCYIYRIDASDRLTFVNSDFLAFAQANGAPELSEAALVGRSVWDYISGVQVQDIYRSLFGMVRSGARIDNLPFRCDSPNLRRFMKLALRSLGDGEIELRGSLLQEQARYDVRLLVDCAAPNSGGYLEVCSWCKRVLSERNHWLELEDAIGKMNLMAPLAMPELNQSVCPTCEAGAMKELAAVEMTG